MISDSETPNATLSLEHASLVREELERALSSRIFRNSDRMSRFLRFIVEVTLENRAAELKETVVGTAVFDRDADYNPKTDPVVRNEARRLRNKLEQFYAEEREGAQIQISLPKGGYVPNFVLLTADAPGSKLAPKSLQTEVVTTESIDSPKATHAKLKKGDNRLYWVAGSTMLGLLVLLGTVLIWTNYRKRPIVNVPHFAPLTSYPGRELQSAISPDGKLVAFVWDGNVGNFDIYLKSSDGQPIRLTTDPAHDLHPAWSPDGQQIAFLRANKDKLQVILIPSTGGHERNLCELEGIGFGGFAPDATVMKGHPGPVWSPDGQYLAVTTHIPGDEGNGIYLISLTTGNRRKLTSPPKDEEDYFPSFSPDGKWLTFARYFSNSSTDLFVMRLDGGTPRPLTNEHMDIRGIAWLDDNRNIVFSSNRSGSYALWRLSLRDRLSPQLIPTVSENAIEPSVSRDGKWIAYTDCAWNTDIWRADLAKGTRKKLIASTRQSHSAQYSPDGRKIAFVSDQSGAWEIWVSNADGSNPGKLTSFNGPMLGTPHWSPDGRWIAFDARPHGKSSIFLINSEGGTPWRLQPDISFEERMPSWSHDGRWIYFNSERGGKVQIWKTPAQGGPATLVCPQTGYDTAESSDGTILYFTNNEPGIWAVPITGGEGTRVNPLVAVTPRRLWYVSSAGLYFIDDDAESKSIELYRNHTTRPETLIPIESNVLSGTPSLSISPDQRWALYARLDEVHSDIRTVRDAW